MKSIKVDKIVLVEKVKANRENHITEYNEAVGGYRQLLLDWLETTLSEVRAEKLDYPSFDEVRPQSHQKDYDRVLAMLDMSLESAIELDEREFSRYVMDSWDWKEVFTMSNAKYLSNAQNH